MAETVAIKVEHVNKQFLLPHEKKNTIKSLFTSLTKRKTTYSNQRALEDISFEIQHGEFFGIVGRNGNGKSTLLKIIAGIYQPSQGTIAVNGRLVPFIELGVGFNAELTGRENVFLNGAILGFTRSQIGANYNKIVEFAELSEFMDQKLKNYSSGMQVRLAFACATMAEADILLVDEVLAVGDADFQRKCFNYFRLLKKNKKTVVFVSHDMNAIREYCDRAVLIDESVMKASGSAESVAQEYSKLFLGAKTGEDANGADGADSKSRSWGSHAVTFTGASAIIKGEQLKVMAHIKARKDFDKIIYGLHIFSSAGQEITAMNNRMIGAHDIDRIRRGESIVINWDVLNIFSDGDYLITLTMVDPSGDVIEWNNEICSFTILRAERSTTPVVPPIKVTIEREPSK